MPNPIALTQQFLVLLNQSYPEPGQMIHLETSYYKIPGIKELVGGVEEDKRLSRDQYQKLEFFFNALVEQGYLQTLNNGWHKISFNGFKYLAELESDASKSLLCFVAMSFDKTETEIYAYGIKPAVEATGYEPYRVDEQHLAQEQTINDAMMAAIKKCGFMITDFTGQRPNVYFEAGYGLGRGLKVIYTCHADHFAETHFDTNNYPHIIYSSTEELRLKLIAKIEAWVKK
jgi:hypothetical protein